MSTEHFFALHRGIADASSDPAIGLKLGTEERVERYDPVKQAVVAHQDRQFRSQGAGAARRFYGANKSNEVPFIEDI